MDDFKTVRLVESLEAGNIYFVTGRNGAGKSRFIHAATKHLSDIEGPVGTRFKRIICFSGTLHDKYPTEVYRHANKSESVVYLGYRVATNMFSVMAPFRRLVGSICDPQNFGRAALALDYLQTINISGQIEIRLQPVRPKPESAVMVGLRFDLASLKDNVGPLQEMLEQVKNHEVKISDIKFRKSGKIYRLNSLSSGEKSYILAILGVCFCGGSNAIAFYDEPENSLHPEWHLKIVRDMVDIISRLYPDTALVVATHSPLVASSVGGEKTYVCDFPEGQRWHKSNLYGKTNDAILTEHFHLLSPRSKEVAILMQRCLDEIVHGRTKEFKFSGLVEELTNMRLNIDKADPLFGVYSTIVKYSE